MNDRLRQREFTLGRAQTLIGRHRFVADHQRRGIGKADILAGHAHHAPREKERIFAALQHPRRTSRAPHPGSDPRTALCSAEMRL